MEADSKLKNLRVVHLTTTIERGGAENYLVDLIRAQIDAGMGPIGCYYLKGDAYWQSALEEMGVTVEALHSKFYGDFRALIRLRRLLRRFHPDVVHLHGAPVEAYYAIAVAMLRPHWKVLLTRHEPRRRLFRYPGFKLLDGRISRIADHIIAVSASVRAADLERRPALGDRTSVVHHGIDAAFSTGSKDGRQTVRDEFGIADNEILVGTIARHTSEKSIDILLRAFAETSRRLPEKPLKLLLVGRGPLTEELKGLSDQLGIADRTIWLPFRDDVPSVLGALDIFVLASREEGFGIVLIEAMSCGKPIIACDVDAIPEIVLDGETGLIVPPLDHQAMAIAMERLVVDHEARARLGEAGRVRAERFFSTPTMQANTLAVYDALYRDTASA